MFGTFGTAWQDNESGVGCLIYMNGDQSGYEILDDCQLKPWDDASFFYQNGSSEVSGVYGPNEDLYMIVN